MTPAVRKLCAALALSAAACLGLLKSEGFTPVAIIPVRGDVPTLGYGSTAGVKMGDTITEPEARKRAEGEIRDVYQAAIHKCAGDVMLTQGEHDALIDLAYNVGAEKVCGFSIIRKFRAGDYAAGCAAILTVDMLNGKHCREPANLGNVQGCRGIMNRRQRQYDLCTRSST